MAVLDTVAVSGTDYTIQDTTARTNATNAWNKAITVESEEHVNRQSPAAFFHTNPETNADNTYSGAHGAGYLFFWNSFNLSTANAGWYPRGMLMRTTKAVTAGTLINPGVNCEEYMLGTIFDTIKTYVGSDGKLHFTNAAGADSVLNFSSFDPFNNREYKEFLNGTATSATINATNAVIFTGYWGNEASGNMYGTKTFIKTGANVVLMTQQGYYERLGYTGVTKNSVTLTFNPYGAIVWTYEAYKF